MTTWQERYHIHDKKSISHRLPRGWFPKSELHGQSNGHEQTPICVARHSPEHKLLMEQLALEQEQRYQGA